MPLHLAGLNSRIGLGPLLSVSPIIFIFVVGFGTYITNGCEDSKLIQICLLPYVRRWEGSSLIGHQVCQPEAWGGITWLSLSNGGSWKKHISVGRSEREDEGCACTQPAVEMVHSFRSLSAVILGLQVLHDIVSDHFGPHTGSLPLFRGRSLPTCVCTFLWMSIRLR